MQHADTGLLASTACTVLYSGRQRASICETACMLMPLNLTIFSNCVSEFVRRTRHVYCWQRCRRRTRRSRIRVVMVHKVLVVYMLLHLHNERPRLLQSGRIFTQSCCDSGTLPPLEHRFDGSWNQLVFHDELVIHVFEQ